MNTPIIQELENGLLRTDLPEFRVGDTVRVHYKIVEGDKDRIQVFQGVRDEASPRWGTQHVHRAQSQLQRPAWSAFSCSTRRASTRSR